VHSTRRIGSTTWSGAKRGVGGEHGEKRVKHASLFVSSARRRVFHTFRGSYRRPRTRFGFGFTWCYRIGAHSDGLFRQAPRIWNL